MADTEAREFAALASQEAFAASAAESPDAPALAARAAALFAALSS